MQFTRMSEVTYLLEDIHLLAISSHNTERYRNSKYVLLITKMLSFVPKQQHLWGKLL